MGILDSNSNNSDGTIFDDLTGSRLMRFVMRKLRVLGVLAESSLTGTSGVAKGSDETITVNQSGTAGYTAWFLNMVHTATGSGVKLLIDLQVAGTSMFKVTSTGILTAASNIISTAGNIVATAGDVIVSTAGKGIQIKEGSNARMGSSTLVAGTVTVANTSVTANTRIFVSDLTAGGTAGNITITRSAGVSFTITSSNNADTRTMVWHLIEPAT